MGDLAGLVGGSGLGGPDAFLALDDELGEAADVLRGLAGGDLDDPLGHVVDEVPVVADEQHGAGEVLELLFEPQHRVDVEVVGGLVEHQHVGLLEQQPGEGGPHLPTTRHLGEGPVHVGSGEPEAAEDASGLGLELVAAELFVAALQLAIRGEGGLVAVAELRFEGLEFVLDLEHLTGAPHHLVEDRTLPGVEQFLGQVADDGALLSRHRPLVGLAEADDDLEQRRLAHAVAAHQRDPTTVLQLEAHTRVEGAGAERLRETGDREHPSRLSSGRRRWTVARHRRAGPEDPRHHAEEVPDGHRPELAGVGALCRVVARQLGETTVERG